MSEPINKLSLYDEDGNEIIDNHMLDEDMDAENDENDENDEKGGTQ